MSTIRWSFFASGIEPAQKRDFMRSRSVPLSPTQKELGWGTWRGTRGAAKMP